MVGEKAVQVVMAVAEARDSRRVELGDELLDGEGSACC